MKLNKSQIAIFSSSSWDKIDIYTSEMCCSIISSPSSIFENDLVSIKKLNKSICYQNSQMAIFSSSSLDKIDIYTLEMCCLIISSPSSIFENDLV